MPTGAVAVVVVIVGVAELLLASGTVETTATSSRSAQRPVRSFWHAPIFTQGITRLLLSIHVTSTTAALNKRSAVFCLDFDSVCPTKLAVGCQWKEQRVDSPLHTDLRMGGNQTDPVAEDTQHPTLY